MLVLPSQYVPFPENPSLQVQVKLPALLLQVALPSHGVVSHSSISKETNQVNESFGHNCDLKLGSFILFSFIFLSSEDKRNVTLSSAELQNRQPPNRVYYLPLLLLATPKMSKINSPLTMVQSLYFNPFGRSKILRRILLSGALHHDTRLL